MTAVGCEALFHPAARAMLPLTQQLQHLALGLIAEFRPAVSTQPSDHYPNQPSDHYPNTAGLLPLPRHSLLRLRRQGQRPPRLRAQARQRLVRSSREPTALHAPRMAVPRPALSFSRDPNASRLKDRSTSHTSSRCSRPPASRRRRSQRTRCATASTTRAASPTRRCSTSWRRARTAASPQRGARVAESSASRRGR